jgi:hypothetical protein
MKHFKGGRKIYKFGNLCSSTLNCVNKAVLSVQYTCLWRTIWGSQGDLNIDSGLLGCSGEAHCLHLQSYAAQQYKVSTYMFTHCSWYRNKITFRKGILTNTSMQQHWLRHTFYLVIHLFFTSKFFDFSHEEPSSHVFACTAEATPRITISWRENSRTRSDSSLCQQFSAMASTRYHM